MLSNLHCKFNMSNLLSDADTERLKRGSKQDRGPLYTAVHKHVVKKIQDANTGLANVNYNFLLSFYYA